MIDIKDINEYIELCKIFGGCYDLVQTNGGNISIKNKNQILIKRSGFKMIETELHKGYVICDINKIDFTSENIQSSIIAGGGTPSIETFFHLLPKKYIVHLHPIKLLHLLSLEIWKEKITELFGQSLCIEYKKPGLELSKKILESYNNESIIFLQNHGIIVCSDNKDDIYNIMNNVTNIYDYNRFPSTNILFMKDLYSRIKDKVILSSFIPFLKNDRYFYKLSPDLLLYLGESPITFESSYSLDIDLNKKIIIYKDILYLIADTFDKVKNLEEMVRTYYLVLESGSSDKYHEISNDEKKSLETWDKEILRLNSN